MTQLVIRYHLLSFAIIRYHMLSFVIPCPTNKKSYGGKSVNLGMHSYEIMSIHAM